MSYLGAQNSIALGVQGIIVIDTGGGTIAVVTDPYWPYVSMLLHGDGTNAAQNNTFLDGSTNNFTVTRNGNTTQGSFNPFVKTYPYAVATNGGSAYFDGTGDYLTVPDSTAFTLGSNVFTAECWIYPTTSGTAGYFAGQSDATNTNPSFIMGKFASDRIGCYVYQGSGYLTQSASTVAINAWSHIAFVRDVSGILRLYINGVQDGTNSFLSGSIDNSPAVFGVGSAGAYVSAGTFAGYVSNFRLVNGTCLYPSSTTFTPPTAPLTAVTNTALLLGMSNGAIYDNAELNNLETVANAQISTSVFKYGTGALKFNGTTDYLSSPPKAEFNLGAGDFTIECWVNFTNLTVSPVFAGQTNNTLGELSFYLQVSSTGAFISSVQNSGYVYKTITSSIGVITSGTWYHISLVRDGNTNRQYVNGVQTGTIDVTGFTVRSSVNVFGVGGTLYTTALPTGYIDDFRFTKGICRYPSGTTFTPPTAAFPNLGPTYPSGTATQRAIFGFGADGGGSPYSMTNIVSNTGVVAGDTTGVGTARGALAAAGYGGDKAIFGFGSVSGAGTAKTNLVSNTGVVATDTTGVGWVRYSLAASGYGSTGQAIFGFGYALDVTPTAITSLVSNTGVVAADTAGVGTARNSLAAAKYGTDKAIFGFGIISGVSTALTNLVSNTGVVSTDTAGVGTARNAPSAAGYGTDKAVFGWGYTGAAYVSTTNLVSNTGVVATDTTGVGTVGYFRSAAGYGGDKAIFGYGYNGTAVTSVTNLVSNTGVVATDTTGVGTARNQPAAAGFSYS